MTLELRWKNHPNRVRRFGRLFTETRVLTGVTVIRRMQTPSIKRQKQPTLEANHSGCGCSPRRSVVPKPPNLGKEAQNLKKLTRPTRLYRG